VVVLAFTSTWDFASVLAAILVSTFCLASVLALVATLAFVRVLALTAAFWDCLDLAEVLDSVLA